MLWDILKYSDRFQFGFEVLYSLMSLLFVITASHYSRHTGSDTSLATVSYSFVSKNAKIKFGAIIAVDNDNISNKFIPKTLYIIVFLYSTR